LPDAAPAGTRLNRLCEPAAVARIASADGHRGSGRRGKFERADGGTLPLDEVSDLAVSAQAKLLRAIQDLAIERVGGTEAHRGGHPHRLNISYHTLDEYLQYGTARSRPAGKRVPAWAREEPGEPTA